MLLVYSAHAQKEELIKIQQTNSFQRPYLQQVYSELYVDGVKTENLSTYLEYRDSSIYMNASPIEIWIMDSSQYVVDNLNKMVFLLPKKHSNYSNNDTLYDWSRMDSIGRRTPTDSGFYIDVVYGSELTSKKLRLYYSQDYLMQSYSMDYKEYSNGKEESKTLKCWLYHGQLEKLELELPLVFKNGQPILKENYKSYELYNMLQNGTYEDIK